MIFVPGDHICDATNRNGKCVRITPVTCRVNTVEDLRSLNRRLIPKCYGCAGTGCDFCRYTGTGVITIQPGCDVCADKMSNTCPALHVTPFDVCIQAVSPVVQSLATARTQDLLRAGIAVVYKHPDSPTAPALIRSHPITGGPRYEAKNLQLPRKLGDVIVEAKVLPSPPSRRN